MVGCKPGAYCAREAADTVTQLLAMRANYTVHAFTDLLSEGAPFHAKGHSKRPLSGLEVPTLAKLDVRLGSLDQWRQHWEQVLLHHLNATDYCLAKLVDEKIKALDKSSLEKGGSMVPCPAPASTLPPAPAAAPPSEPQKEWSIDALYRFTHHDFDTVETLQLDYEVPAVRIKLADFNFAGLSD